MLWPWRKPQEAVSCQEDVKRLWTAFRQLESRLDDLEARLGETRLKYLEAIDKMLAKMSGRVAARMRRQEREDDEEPPPEEPQSTNYAGVLGRRPPLRGW